jgi:hypothetical protein
MKVPLILYYFTNEFRSNTNKTFLYVIVMDNIIIHSLKQF